MLAHRPIRGPKGTRTGEHSGENLTHRELGPRRQSEIAAHLTVGRHPELATKRARLREAHGIRDTREDLER
ncbi:MAG: hypothetical protein ACPHRO_05410, partial [Nannocystaceae bacterium]